MSAAAIEVVVGARPNFVKAAALWRALEAKKPASLTLSLVHTGQHRAAELAVAFGRALGLPAPHVALDIGVTATHGQQTAAILERYERHLLERPAPPRAVVVIGDVNSTLACTLAAAKLGIASRTSRPACARFDRAMPEELNRIARRRHQRALPRERAERGRRTSAARASTEARVGCVGNLMVDTLAHELARCARARRARAARLARALRLRRRCTGPPTSTIRPGSPPLVDALAEVAARLPVVFPVHPRTAARLDAAGLRGRLERGVRALDPLGYLRLHRPDGAAEVVITDSGGVQEETTWLGVPCLTLRDNTERPITVERGTNGLVGRDPRQLASCVAAALDATWRRPTIDGWDGRAAERAADALLERYG